MATKTLFHFPTIDMLESFGGGPKTTYVLGGEA